MQRALCEVTADAEGFGVGEMTWRGLRPGEHIVTASRGGVVLAKQRLTADAAGGLTAMLATSAIEPLQIRIACALATEPGPSLPTP